MAGAQFGLAGFQAVEPGFVPDLAGAQFLLAGAQFGLAGFQAVETGQDFGDDGFQAGYAFFELGDVGAHFRHGGFQDGYPLVQGRQGGVGLLHKAVERIGQRGDAGLGGGGEFGVLAGHPRHDGRQFPEGGVRDIVAELRPERRVGVEGVQDVLESADGRGSQGYLCSGGWHSTAGRGSDAGHYTPSYRRRSKPGAIRLSAAPEMYGTMRRGFCRRRETPGVLLSIRH